MDGPQGVTPHYLGRWGGDSVRRYTAQAFAVRYGQLSLDVAAACASRRVPLHTELWELPAEAAAASASSSRLDGEAVVEEILGEGVPGVMEAAVEEVKPQRAAEAGDIRFVTNRGTGVTHKVPPGWSVAQPRAGWRAACGWAFAGDCALLAASLPPAPWCGRPGCFKGCRPGDDGDSGSSDG